MRNRFLYRRIRVSRSLTTGAALAMACFFAHYSPAVGQAPTPGAGGYAAGLPANAAGAAANEVTKFSGKLKDARGNVIVVTREDGTDCMVQFPDEITSLKFSAAAVPGYLRRGTPVRFAMAIGPNGAPISPVEKIEIFAPLGPGAVPRNQTAQFTPGVHQAGRQARQRGATPGGRVDVVGTLLMITPQGALAVQAGNTPVKTMVAPNAEIEIQMNNLSLAQAGDEVEVEGFYNPPDETKVKAQRIKITTDRVIGEAPAQPNRKERSKRNKNALPTDQPDPTADGEAGPATPGQIPTATDTPTP
ncbi:hypothetical protein [Allorhodopirellula solitaria]|uniref:DUF5666 domain-containing protein n=1 Tax=Allorhodopirellula solitaria TaxID=2527987 RepID=A0A5C5XQ23_9BACT|nr:hypothetical protein [Allorhodopirellula solitaria]TWT64689.1 hypothetical protein CA85_38220 [Allorhodopirellula solitaria]